MRRIYLLLCAAFALFLVACTSEEPLTPKEISPLESRGNHVTVPQALQRAEKMLESLDKSQGLTRSGHKNRIVLDIECIRSSAKTRSSDGSMPDTLYYVINYANGDGFAIVSADNRTVPIYAVSAEGNCNIEDTVFNKGLADFFRCMEYDILCTARGTDIFPVDTIIYNPPTDVVIPIVEKVDPWFSFSVSTWHQGDPLNRYCLNKNGHVCSVGCAAIGVGQIMSFYRHPLGYHNHLYYWDEMTSSHSSESLAHFLSDLGNAENLDMDYGSDESSASPYNIDRTFYNMGYEHVGNGITFSTKDAVAALKVNPIVMVGYGFKGSRFIGHIWTIDGYITYLDQVKFDDSVPMFHCVWGWGGSGNGYYYFRKGFDLGDPEEVDFPYGEDPKPKFTSGFEFWTGFKIRN